MYKKLDFNVPLLQNDGEPQMRQKVDTRKIKKMPDGSVKAEPLTDEEGYVILESIPLCELLSNIVNAMYGGEENLEADKRLARGRLARKLADKSGGSKKNYTGEELDILKEAMLKSQCSPSLIAQVDDIVNALDTGGLNGHSTEGEARSQAAA